MNTSFPCPPRPPDGLFWVISAFKEEVGKKIDLAGILQTKKDLWPKLTGGNLGGCPGADMSVMKEARARDGDISTDKLWHVALLPRE